MLYYLLCLSAVVCFATYPTLVKLVLAQNESAPIILLVSLATSLVLMFVFGFLREIKQYIRHKQQDPYLILIGLFSGAIAPLCIGMGLANSNVTNSVLITSLQIPFSAVLSAMILKEKISRIYKAGLIIFIIGIILYSTNFFQSGLLLSTYDIFFIIAAFCYALSDILYKKKLTHLSFDIILLSRSLFGSFFLFLANLVLTQNHTISLPTLPVTHVYIGLVILIPILLGQRLWYLSLKKIPAAKASMYITLYPVFATLFGFMILREAVTGTMLVSGIIMIAGLVIAQLHFKKHPSHSRHIHLQHFKQQ